MKTDFLNLIPSALTIIYATYGTWFLVKEIFCSVIPFTLVLTILIITCIYFLRVSPPDSAAVDAVLGREPHLENPNGAYVMKTVAHRGAGLDAPENSLTAFQLCHEKGCDAIEFDVTLTKDNVPIVFHDNNLERMANSDLVINDATWDQLHNLDISVNHSLRDRFQGTYIPTLEEAVTQMLSSGQRMFIDIKDNNIKMVSVIIDLFNKHPELISKAAVTSFFPNIIYLIRRSNPNIVCCLAWRPHVFAHDSFKYPEGKGIRRANHWYRHYILSFFDILHFWALSRITYYVLGLSVILLHKDSLSGEAVIKWRTKGVRVIPWSINSPIEKQHVARNLKLTYLTDTLTGENTVHSVTS